MIRRTKTDNDNAQSHEQEESKLKRTINENVAK